MIKGNRNNELTDFHYGFIYRCSFSPSFLPMILLLTVNTGSFKPCHVACELGRPQSTDQSIANVPPTTEGWCTQLR